jgi:hypothetical protein
MLISFLLAHLLPVLLLPQLLPLQPLDVSRHILNGFVYVH